MSDDSDAGAGAVESAEQIHAQLLGMRGKAEALLVTIEEANRKANSESGYAFNAKQNAEEHAKAIAQIKGTVEADSNWLEQTKRNATEVADAALAAKRAADGDSKLAQAARLAAEAELSAAKTSSAAVTDALTAAKTSREGADASAKRASDDAGAVTKARAEVEASASTVQALSTQVSEASAKVQGEAQTVSNRFSSSQEMIAGVKDATETSKAVQSRVEAYEQKLKEVTTQYDELRAKIENLLPGATSAGLASAFKDQKARFHWPQWIWLGTFVLTIVALLWVASTGQEPLKPEETLTWNVVLRHVANRLPLAVPLVWLALYAGRNYTSALRLQEDYAYKEAIATSFEGFRREMLNVPGNAAQVAPLLILCENVLTTLGQRPGRLYDGGHDDVTPLTPILKMLKESGILDKAGSLIGKKTEVVSSAEPGV